MTIGRVKSIIDFSVSKAIYDTNHVIKVLFKRLPNYGYSCNACVNVK